MLLKIHNPDRGASLLEYGTVIVLVCALLGAIYATGLTSTITDAVDTAADGLYTPQAGGEDPSGSGGADGNGDGHGNGDTGTRSGDGDEDSHGEDEDEGSDGGGGGGGNDGDGDKSVLQHVGDFFTSAGGAIVDDVTGLVDVFTTNPIDTITDTWNGIKEDPLSLIISKETRDAWKNGDYGSALGSGAWDIGSWFIPGAGWAAKAGKLGRLGGGPSTPDTPNRPRDDRADGDGDRRDNDGNGRSCARSSFLPGTPVLMADGSTTAVQDIRIGDEVWAFDPLTGEEGPRPVTALPGGTGEKTLVDISVDDGNGTTATITATGEHPFWDPEHAEWVDAADLEPGTRLRGSTGDWAQVTTAETRTVRDQQVHNLTVDDLNTYYVEVGGSTALVHNQNGYDCGNDLDETLDGIDTRHGPEVTQGIEHMLDEIDAGKTNHQIAGRNSLDDLATYLAGRQGRSTHTDGNTGNRVSYDPSTKDANGNGVIVIETDYSVHAYHMSPDEWNRKVNSGRYVED